MATTEKLQNEILLKEETFLKEEKAKLTEQLKKLKVEEMALMKLLKADKTSPHNKAMELFSKNSQLTSSSSQRVDNFETETDINHIPLQALSNIDMGNHSDVGEEEEDDEDDDLEDDDTEYGQQLMNAMSNLHHQNSNMDPGVSRSVFQSVLREEFEDLDEDEDDYFD